ncbi:hypothetical protein [Dialister micraerophilus]|uniref:Uncharacterized protein n=1 Tax=Dialister micraerophilus DSM 19965 TaxID=888062 RepID=F2BXN9_9FIRM|nr:hypothetical protein [Dialister micraerophilus]EGF13310.1 hypothetical protein HMPREF9083_0957 [Dialister micraerophilus DSM 19965]
MKYIKNNLLQIITFVLFAIVIWQQYQISDLQERMMNIESVKYDNQLNDIRWEAETALSENKEQKKDIRALQKQTSENRFNLLKLSWDFYRK